MRFIEKEKVFKAGFFFLAALFTLSISLILFFEGLSPREVPSVGKGRPVLSRSEPFSLPLVLSEKKIPIPLPNVQRELAFSSDLPRPDLETLSSGSLIVRLKKNGSVKKVTLPARIDLMYGKGLNFSENKSPFWIEIDPFSLVHVFVERNGETNELVTFESEIEKAPLHTFQDYPEGSPFFQLGKGTLLGTDLFLRNYVGGQKAVRVELEGNSFLLKEGDFLSFFEGKWKKVAAPIKGAPLAQVSSLNDKVVEFDGWGLDEYSRLSLSLNKAASFKTKVDEFLTSVRIRSEKQISCMLEKQCFVLKAGDYCLKQESRWKVLRKEEERDAYLRGELEGELFVFDRIDQKGGQKVLQGSFFDTGRSQMVPIEYIATSQKKISKGRK